MAGRIPRALITLLGLAAAAPAPAALQVGAPEQVADLCPGSCSAEPRLLRPHAGSLHFATLNFGEPAATGLWRVAPGQVVPERLDPGHFTQAVVAGDRLFVVRQEAFVEVLDPDGGTTPLVETDGIFWPVTVAGDRVFVSGYPPIDPQGLWVTDGSLPGTRLLGSWSHGCPAFPWDQRYMPDSLTFAGDTLFFVLYEETGGCGTVLWKSDGTVEGTVPVADVALGQHLRLAALGNRVVYPTVDGALWITDGSSEGTHQLAAFPALSVPISAGALVYFRARDEEGDWSLWRTDGTVEGTFRLAPADEWSPSQPMATGLLLLTRSDEAHGTELWRTDGTVAGTRLVRDIRPGTEGSGPHSLTATGALVAFRADDGAHGDEPWITDGTEAGTVALGDLNPGPAGSASALVSGSFALLRGFLYFAADDGVTGQELWRVAIAAAGSPPPPPPADAIEISAPELGAYRLWVRISAAGAVQPVRREAACIPETVCVSGALPGRSELFVRIVGPKPNGRLWPTLVRFSTSTIEVWIEQLGTGELRHYRLEGAAPGSSDLDGLFDRHGFEP
jgi:ELWxxDGT repeat protein